MKIKGFSLLFSLMLCAVSAFGDYVDLTVAGNSGSISTGGFFQQIPDQSTGTGVISPFLRIQANTTESGWNTDSNQGPIDTKTGLWTHSLLVSAVPIVNIGGTDYLQFLLDINENTSTSDKQTPPEDALLSLDNVRIYTADSGSITGTSLADLESAATFRWGFDTSAGVDDWVGLNYSLNPGSGAGDMFMYVPASSFLGLGSKYLYLYSAFGGKLGGWSSSDGFEEWSLIKNASVVPEPTFYGLLSLGLAGLVVAARKRRSA